MQLKEIKKLASLARIDMSKKEMLKIAEDFDSILAYVNQVQEVVKLIPANSTEEDKEDYSYLRFGNIMREDIPTKNPGENADKIINEMPDEEDRFLKVRHIL